MSITSIRLKAEIEIPLEQFSKKLDRSKNYIINQALKGFVAWQKLAEKRWNETLPALEPAKQGHTVPAEKVFEWMRSWNSDGELPRPKVKK